MRRILRVGSGLMISAVLLAGCGSGASTPAPLDAQPSINISVPLDVAGCDGTGNCFAVGTTGLDSAPTAAVQVTTDGKVWTAESTPNAPSTTFAASGCWSNGCLFGGSNATGDVVWLVRASSVYAVAAPANGRGALSISCFRSSQCALLDTDVNGHGRLSFTRNAGVSWSTPQLLSPSSGQQQLSIACTDAQHCVAGNSMLTPGTAGLWETTVDGATNWTSYSGAWSSISNINCVANTCVALGTNTLGVATLIESINSGVSWTTVKSQFKHSAVALACVTVSKCVVAGSSTVGGSSIERYDGSTWTNLTLRYVPDALVSLSCSTVRCAAVSNQSAVITTP